MIRYKTGGRFIWKLFMMKGSVFPGAAAVAIPSAIISAVAVLLMESGHLEYLSEKDAVVKEGGGSVTAGFNFLIGFLVVFRTSQAYNRFWDGATAQHLMRAEWFDAAAALCAFTKFSKAPEAAVNVFTQTLIRLFSVLHAVALAEIEDSNSDDIDDVLAFRFELIDAGSLDHETMNVLKDSHEKTELVFQWIQQLIVENIQTDVLSIPAPILSRAFQEIANGMVAAHEAIKISSIPFPFPYAQTCDLLLVIHWLITPLMVSQFVPRAHIAFCFTFVQVFAMWALNMIAVEIENPFGDDDNDLDGEAMQFEMNRHLLMLVQDSTKRTPRLLHGDGEILRNHSRRMRKSLVEVWSEYGVDDTRTMLQEEMTTSSTSQPRRDTEKSFKTGSSLESGLSNLTWPDHSCRSQNTYGTGYHGSESMGSQSRGSQTTYSHDTVETFGDSPFPTAHYTVGNSKDLSIGRSLRHLRDRSKKHGADSHKTSSEGRSTDRSPRGNIAEELAPRLEQRLCKLESQRKSGSMEKQLQQQNDADLGCLSPASGDFPSEWSHTYGNNGISRIDEENESDRAQSELAASRSEELIASLSRGSLTRSGVAKSPTQRCADNAIAPPVPRVLPSPQG